MAKNVQPKKPAKKTADAAPAKRKPAAKPAKPAKPATRTASAEKPAPKSTAPKPAGEGALPVRPLFPIVGIGASAGGLEALERFLSHVPGNSGMAYIVVQHMDPSRRGALPELLQRATPMRVVEAGDRTRVQPDHVYVIPSNKDMALRDGILHLTVPEAPRGLRLPIDFFFRSLAADHEILAIGVILSGMGSDGTLGMRAIKDSAGLTLAQTPASAKFDSMPRSAIDAGVVDLVASAEELPARIAGFLQHTPLTHPEAGTEGQTHGALDKILLLLRVQTGHDFSLYKKSTLYRRIERRMGIHQVDRIAGYARFLRENPQEVDLLFKELLIGVTNFFRDPDSWETLKNEALPALFAAIPAGRGLRAWVTGCSTGEEAYSLAIVFKEAFEKAKPPGRFSLQIYATDLDQSAIDKARIGNYPSNIVADVSTERLTRFFVANESGYSVSKEIREMVIFAPQNVIMDPPFTKLDVLCCRNLMIYLGSELQKKLLPLFHYSLNSGGILFLGSAETIGNFTDLFTPIDSKARLYRRGEGGQRLVDVEFPTRLLPAVVGGAEDIKPLAPVPNLQGLADQLLLQRFTPAAVFMNGKGDIIFINGRTGKYLEPAAGKANMNIFAMARDGLRHELASAMQRARQQEGPVVVTGIKVENGNTHYVTLTVEVIDAPDALAGMFVAVFRAEPTPPHHGIRRRGGVAAVSVAELESEVQSLREQLQTTREEMQSSQEELKSANEELQSTNEELQSTNEELTTSKEEMQSLNEELQTVNAELQSKVEDLSSASNDMKNLLNSTDIATVFLDGLLHVRRFTNSATRIVKLIPGDVGRPLSDIVSALDYPQLHRDAEEVLRTLIFSEKEAATRDGRRWFRVRIMPYRTSENVIDGVVITFVDISEAKTLEGRLRDALRRDGGDRADA